MADTTALMKQRILNMALRGELVKQSEDEITLQEMFTQINYQNEQLIKDKKIKKITSLSKIEEDEILFEIPNNWILSRLGEITNIRRGASPRPIKNFITENEDGVNWIKIGDSIKGKKHISNTFQQITKEGALKSVFVEPGDLIMSNSMSFGHAYIMNTSGCIHDGWLAFKFNKNLIYSDWLLYILNASYSSFEKLAVGTSVRNLNINKVKSVLIGLPPLSEQKRIVTKIESAFAVIDKINEKKADSLQTIKNIRKTALQNAMQGLLVTQDETDEPASELIKNIEIEKKQLIKEKILKEEKSLTKSDIKKFPYQIPMNWEWTRLGIIGLWGAGSTPLRSNPLFWKNGTIPWIKTGELNNSYIEDSEEYITKEALEKTSVRLNNPGDVLIAMYGATIGKLSILNISATTNQACCACTPFKGINNKYLFYYLLSNKQQFINNSEGGAQPNISKTKIINHLIPLPPFEEQIRIVKKLDQVMKLCDKMERILNGSRTEIINEVITN